MSHGVECDISVPECLAGLVLPMLPRLWQIEALTTSDHLLRNEGKVLDHDGVNACDVRR